MKRELTIYSTVRPRGKFAIGNAMTLLGQVRERELSVYGTSRPRGINNNAMALFRPVKRELTVYGTSRPGGVNKNAKTFRKQNQKQKRKLK